MHHVPNPGEPGFDPNQKKFYCLDMFPPSGKGLHVGHPLGYIGTDIICRFRRMNGEAVLHPMGWDAFGLPAEQYAIQTGVHPATTTRTAIDTYRRQLKSFDFRTTGPAKWPPSIAITTDGRSGSGCKRTKAFVIHEPTKPLRSTCSKTHWQPAI